MKSFADAIGLDFILMKENARSHTDWVAAAVSNLRQEKYIEYVEYNSFCFVALCHNIFVVHYISFHLMITNHPSFLGQWIAYGAIFFVHI